MQLLIYGFTSKLSALQVRLGVLTRCVFFAVLAYERVTRFACRRRCVRACVLRASDLPLFLPFSCPRASCMSASSGCEGKGKGQGQGEKEGLLKKEPLPLEKEEGSSVI